MATSSSNPANGIPNDNEFIYNQETVKIESQKSVPTSLSGLEFEESDTVTLRFRESTGLLKRHFFHSSFSHNLLMIDLLFACD